jgi:hypothetical protein
VSTDKSWTQRFKDALREDIKSNPKTAILGGIMLSISFGMATERYIVNPLQQHYSQDKYDISEPD